MPGQLAVSTWCIEPLCHTYTAVTLLQQPHCDHQLTFLPNSSDKPVMVPIKDSSLVDGSQKQMLAPQLLLRFVPKRKLQFPVLYLLTKFVIVHSHCPAPHPDLLQSGDRRESQGSSNPDIRWRLLFLRSSRSEFSLNLSTIKICPPLPSGPLVWVMW